MERKWKAIRTGFYAAAAAELLRLEHGFSPGINRRNSITCHFELLCLIFAQESHVRAILNLSDNPEFAASSDRRHKVVPGINEWAESIGYTEEVKSVVDLIFQNELHVDSEGVKPFQRSFQNNPQFTLYLFQNVGGELLNARSSMPLAKLKLRMLYLVSAYQCSSIYEFKRQKLSKEINDQERLLRSEESQMRRKQGTLTQKQRIEEIKDNLTKLEDEYSSFADLASWSEKPPHGQKKRSWVKRLQHNVGRLSQKIQSKLTKSQQAMLFPGKGAAERIICSEKIYQILDELETEDLRIEDLKILV